MLEWCHIWEGAPQSSHSNHDIIQNHLHVPVGDYFPTDSVCLVIVLISQIVGTGFKYFVTFNVFEVEVTQVFNEIEWTLGK